MEGMQSAPTAPFVQTVCHLALQFSTVKALQAIY